MIFSAAPVLETWAKSPSCHLPSAYIHFSLRRANLWRCGGCPRASLPVQHDSATMAALISRIPLCARARAWLGSFPFFLEVAFLSEVPRFHSMTAEAQRLRCTGPGHVSEGHKDSFTCAHSVTAALPLDTAAASNAHGEHARRLQPTFFKTFGKPPLQPTFVLLRDHTSAASLRTLPTILRHSRTLTSSARNMCKHGKRQAFGKALTLRLAPSLRSRVPGAYRH